MYTAIIKFFIAVFLAVVFTAISIASTSTVSAASWGMMKVLEDMMAAYYAGNMAEVERLSSTASNAANSGNQSFEGTTYAQPEPEPYNPPSYSPVYYEEPVVSPVYTTTVIVKDESGQSPVTTASVNNYLAQGYSPQQAAAQAAADATARGYSAQAVYDSATGNWSVDFTGNCNNPDVVINVSTICSINCGGTPPRGGGGTPPSPVATPAPPSPPAGGGSNGGGGGGGNNGGGNDEGGYSAPPSNNSPSVSPGSPSNQLASTAPCTTHAYLSWTFSDPEDGANQSGYQIQIDDSGSFSSVNYDTGDVSSGIKERYIAVGSQIGFGSTYYWRVRVRDSQGAWSSYVSGSPINPPVHAAPEPSFTTSPEHPSAGEAVQFTSTSTTWGGASIVGYEWGFEGGTPSSSSAQSVAVTFVTEGDQAATLRVTDSDGISCSTESSLTIEQKLPDIREVPPLSTVGNFFSGVFDAFGVIADAAF
jgi:hypothetical protein